MSVVRMRNLRIVDEALVHIHDGNMNRGNAQLGVKFTICESVGGSYMPSWLLEFVEEPATCFLCVVEEAERCSNGS